jgi:hypothetical protein
MSATERRGANLVMLRGGAFPRRSTSETSQNVWMRSFEAHYAPLRMTMLGG